MLKVGKRMPVSDPNIVLLLSDYYFIKFTLTCTKNLNSSKPCVYICVLSEIKLYVINEWFVL